jgi:hypothetical protein
MSDREETVRMAGALESKFEDMCTRIDELEATVDSQRVNIDAITSENEALRRTLEFRTRQRDAVVRKFDVYKIALGRAGMTIAKAIKEAASAVDTEHTVEPPRANVALLHNRL